MAEEGCNLEITRPNDKKTAEEGKDRRVVPSEEGTTSSMTGVGEGCCGKGDGAE